MRFFKENKLEIHHLLTQIVRYERLAGLGSIPLDRITLFALVL